MTDSPTPKRKRRSSAAKRIAARRAAEARAATLSATQVPCADARDTVSTDVQQVATGYRMPKRRDTSRRALAITDAGWRDDLPAQVDLAGRTRAERDAIRDAERDLVHAERTPLGNLHAASDARRWRGEARATRPMPAATHYRLGVTIS